MKSHTNLLGRKVLVNYPSRWSGAKPEHQEQLKVEAAKESCYGMTGEIVAYNPDSSTGRDIIVKLDSGEIVQLWTGAVTITSEAVEGEIITLLRRILVLI